MQRIVDGKRREDEHTHHMVDTAVNGHGSDTVLRYLREAAYERRIQMRQLGLLFGLFAAASIALGTLMSDIGHFLGFVGLAVIFSIGGIAIWWLGRR